MFVVEWLFLMFKSINVKPSFLALEKYYFAGILPFSIGLINVTIANQPEKHFQ